MLRRHYPVSTLLRASPPPTRPGLALAGCPLRLPPLSSSVSRASCAFLRYMPSSLPRWNCRVRLSLTSFATLAFPACPTGRLPHQSFRGLIERSLALRPASSRDHQVILSIEGSDGFVASSAASIATGQATLPRRDFHPLKYTRIHGARTSGDFTSRPRPPPTWIIRALYGSSRSASTRGSTTSRWISSRARASTLG